MKRKIFFGVTALILMIFVGSAYSDFGSFSGTSDYGGSRSSSSSSRSSSSSSSGRSSSGGSIGVIPYHTGIARTDSGLEAPEDEFAELMGAAFVVGVFILFWVLSRASRKAPPLEQAFEEMDEPLKTLKPMNEYLELDPGFDEEKIKTLMSNLYVQMQETWHAKDISSLRPYMTDEFYNQMDMQLDQFRKMNRTDYTERIAVLNVGLKGWRQSAGRDYITVRLNSRIVSYVLDDRTGKLLSGDMNREKFMEYEIELTRKSGIITSPESEGVQTSTCPHCGAPIKLNASAKCEYCGSVLTSVNSDWAICGMKGISQRTV